MAKNLLRALALVSAVAIIPAATASLAAVDVDTYKELDQFMSVFERVRSEYVEQVDDKTLLRGAIDGMLASLDPHSSYLDERGFKSLMTTTDGNYGGLGLSVTQEDGAVKVIAATEDTPAAKAGIKAGDYLTHLDGKLIYGGTLDEAVDQMRGPPGTTVKVTVVRPGRDKPFDVAITRAIIELPAVKWEVKDRVGIINVNSFNKTTTDSVLAAMTGVEKSLGSKPLGYILDLRSNPGGLLDQAVSLSDAFLERGEIVSQRGRAKSDIERYYARPGDAAHGLPVIVLVDAGSASAAEIVAGALQEHHRAIVMGERTFGKGSVQTLLPLSQDTALRLTTARYYTPSGKSVQEGGIKPDIEVPQLSDPDYKDRPRFRESDLRRHLINELKVEDDVVQDDGKPDPRFAATAEELKKKGIEDFQLHYALQTISRLGKVQQASVAAEPKKGTR
ncbi:S41 family peptidase [Sphingomonas sp. LY54]|uniref:S41 family peptidase n=1 Tax=Sphingomonadales TaxID=204457 RepID=UPI002ADEF5F4|nr:MULTISPECIES: S41 family peptidase [Sphingomonadales]MEA1015379.1 S41 family peptidase [Sphingosinicella sp. LY1275]WRP29944.1 S41 family peptidase [Sphingomonas sp. LY54]